MGAYPLLGDEDDVADCRNLAITCGLNFTIVLPRRFG